MMKMKMRASEEEIGVMQERQRGFFTWVRDKIFRHTEWFPGVDNDVHAELVAGSRLLRSIWGGIDEAMEPDKCAECRAMATYLEGPPPVDEPDRLPCADCTPPDFCLQCRAMPGFVCADCTPTDYCLPCRDLATFGVEGPPSLSVWNPWADDGLTEYGRELAEQGELVPPVIRFHPPHNPLSPRAAPATPPATAAARPELHTP